jgi:tight adherence protein C
MTSAAWGAQLGATIAGGLLLVGSRVLALRRPRLETRVLPYLRDLPQLGSRATATSTQGSSAGRGVFGPPLQAAADAVERVLGGAASVRRRLDRAGLPMTVAEFRVQQVVWGLVAFGLAAAYSLVKALTHPGGIDEEIGRAHV